MKSFVLSTLLMAATFGNKPEECGESLGCTYYPDQHVTKHIKCNNDGRLVSLSFNGKVECDKPDWNEIISELTTKSAKDNICCRGVKKDENQKQKPLVVGGHVTTANKYAFIVDIGVNSAEYTGPDCTGSILRTTAPAVILTAAHCGPFNTNFKVSFMNDDTNTSPASGTFDVTLSEIHPNYNSDTGDSDIAILWIAEDISNIAGIETVEIKPVVLGKECCSTGDKLQIIGYGYTSADNKDNTLLQYGDLVYLDRATCNTKSAGFIKITNNMNCANKTGVSGCHGDSGGPLIKIDGTNNQQVGVVHGNATPGDCDPNGISRFTDVGVFYEWIQKYLKQ